MRSTSPIAKIPNATGLPHGLFHVKRLWTTPVRRRTSSDPEDVCVRHEHFHPQARRCNDVPFHVKLLTLWITAVDNCRARAALQIDYCGRCLGYGPALRGAWPQVARI